MPVRTGPTKHRRTRTAAMAIVAVLAAGCSADVINGRALPASGGNSSSAPRPAVPTGELTWAETAGDVTNLMPLIAEGNTTSNANLTVRVLDGLFRVSPSLGYVADPDQGSATSSVSGGQQVVDISIAPDAAWADGQPITADDYEFTISAQRSLVPAQGGCAALLSSSGFDQVERTEKVSTKKLRVYFTTPFADWKGLFAGAGGGSPLLSKHVMDKGTPTDTCAAITQGWPIAGGIPLGAQNGPWLLTADNVDTGANTITLVPNPRYGGDKPRLAKLTYRYFDADEDAASALRTGSVDATYPTPQADLLSSLRQTSDVTTSVNVGSSFEHLDFNVADPLLKYQQIRQAIGLAIDRTALVSRTQSAFGSSARPLGNRLLLSNQQGYVDNSGQYATRNVAAAKRLIESIGGQLGSDNIYRVGGLPLSFRVMTSPGNAVRTSTITELAAQVREAGIALTALPNPDIFAGPDKPTSLAAHGFQIALFAWLGSPSLTTLRSIYYSPIRSGPAGQNYSQGASAAVDTALDGLSTATSSSQQADVANTADRLMWQELWTLPLYQRPTVLAYRDAVQGLKDNAGPAGPLWNSDEISVR